MTDSKAVIIRGLESLKRLADAHTAVMEAYVALEEKRIALKDLVAEMNSVREALVAEKTEIRNSQDEI